MIGTIIMGSTAALLAGTAALELVDGMVDRRRSQQVRPLKPAPVSALNQAQATVVTAEAWSEPEVLRKAA